MAFGNKRPMGDTAHLSIYTLVKENNFIGFKLKFQQKVIVKRHL